jgi:hypothetical protein
MVFVQSMGINYTNNTISFNFSIYFFYLMYFIVQNIKRIQNQTQGKKGVIKKLIINKEE